MEVEQGLSLEERLAQAMIDLRKGHTSNTHNVHQRRDYLVETIKETKNEIDLLKKENDILEELKKKTESLSSQINPIRNIDANLLHDRFHADTRDKSIQTDIVASELQNIPHRAEKFKIINNLSIREKLLQEELRSMQLASNRRGPNYILLKISEYNDIISQIASMSPEGSTSYRDMGIERDTNVPPTNVQSNYLTSEPTSPTTSTKLGVTPSSNNGVQRVHEESDYEGVHLLLSMKRNAFTTCKCGEYLSSITDWSEHQRLCSKSTEKTTGEQCQLCKKTFLTCVALNIHSTKKHNKKKVRTDSVMHCPCGQSFKAKWRQNCVHKLNNHGRHCKAFKEIETQCKICKKGFIDRKSLEYHGLKAHKVAVPVNSC